MILRADNLRVEFRPGEPALPPLSADFLPGQLTAILGPNGAGKSTLLRALAGIPGPGAGGGVWLDQAPIAGWSAEARAARLTCLPQREDLPVGFRVREVVGFGAAAAGPHTDPHADPRSTPEIAVGESLSRLGLTAWADRRLETLSEGQRQRVALARAFAQTRGWLERPGVVLADEPAAALDPALAIDAMALFRELAARGRTVVVVLHDINLARRFAHRALLLDPAGRVAADAPAHEALIPPFLERVFGLPWVEARLPDGSAAVIPAVPNPTI